jgi:hypothetical protein
MISFSAILSTTTENRKVLTLLFDDWHPWLSLEKQGYWMINTGRRPIRPLLQMRMFIIKPTRVAICPVIFHKKTRQMSLPETWGKFCERATVNAWYSALLLFPDCLPSSPSTSELAHYLQHKLSIHFRTCLLKNTLIKFSIHNTCWVPTLS